MTTMNDTTTAAETLQEPSVLLKDVTNWAEYLLDAATAQGVHERLTGTAAELWDASMSYTEAPRWSVQHRQGIHWGLDALIMQPEVLPWIAREARDRLSKTEAAEEVQSTPAPAVTDAKSDLKLQNVMNSIQDLLVAAMDGGCYKLLPPATDALFSAGMSLAEGGSNNEYPFNRRAGYLMSLTALLLAPEVLPVVVRDLRSELLKADPQLAPLAGEVTPLEHAPLAVHHDIDGLGCIVHPDGALLLERFPSPLVTLEPRHAYALSLFMRSPGVSALLEAQHAARETENELEFQADQAEEAARFAARAR